MPIKSMLQWMPVVLDGALVLDGWQAIRGVSTTSATKSSVSEIATCVHVAWVAPGLIGGSGSSVSSTRISGETVVSRSSGVAATVCVRAGCFCNKGGLRLSVELPEFGELVTGEEYSFLCELLLL